MLFIVFKEAATHFIWAKGGKVRVEVIGATYSEGLERVQAFISASNDILSALSEVKFTSYL